MHKFLNSIVFLILLAIVNFLVSPVLAAPPANFQSTTLINSGLDGPSGFEIAPDGRIFILERTGKIKVYKNGQLLATPFADLPSAATGDRGLIGIAFDPEFHLNHYVYFYYTGEDLLNKLVRFDATGDVATGSAFLLYETKSPSELLHVGGSIRFGPDGKIYFAVGDNGKPINAQDLSNPHGKILRINKDGSVPTDNPFYGQAGKLPEIWAYGMRNPWRFQFDSATGKLYGGDVGDYTWEEVNRIEKGGNYGWPNAEGVCSNCPYINPIHAYNHDNLSSAVTGGPVYRGSNFPTSYQGSLFFGDYARGFIKRISLDAQGNSLGAFDFDLSAGSVVDLKVGPDGALYYITYIPGRLVKVSYSLGNSSPIANATADQTKGIEPLTVNFSSAGSSDPDNNPLTYSWNFGDNTFSNLPNPTKTYAAIGTYFVELTVSDGTTSTTSSPIVIQVGTPPTLTIGTPVQGSMYRAGDTIDYSAFASDGAGFDINDAGIQTEILYHHDTHIHPFLGPLTGRTGSFTVPTQNHEADPDTYFEIKVTATDSNGLSETKSVFVYPHKSHNTFTSLVNGLKVLLDGIPTATNQAIEGVVGYIRQLSAPAVQVFNNTVYAFSNWSDNGEIVRDITNQDTDSIYDANFVAVAPFSGQYFDNKDLNGAPVLQRDENIINFDWFDASPDSNIPADEFSARWVKSQYFPQAKYKFTTSSDDGVRLYIDGNLVIDQWVNQNNIHTVTLDLDEGIHEIKMEYFENTGLAHASLNWEFVSSQPTVDPNNYKGEYFDNLNLSGQVKYISSDPKVMFNWGNNPPNPQIGQDNYSVRWTKLTNFEQGVYFFNIVADDGIRVYIDDELVLDKWINQAPTNYQFEKAITAGDHVIKVEYFEDMGGAVAEFDFVKTDKPFPTASENYTAKYWNISFDSPPQIPTSAPVLEREENIIDNNWHQGSPDPTVNNNQFVASWVKTEDFESSNYKFHTVADDGIRVYLDDILILDDWKNHAAKDTFAVRNVSAGIHTIRVEYFEDGGDAVAMFDFAKTTDPETPLPTPPAPTTGFNGEYFNTVDLTGTPVLTRLDQKIDFKWGNGSPDPLMPVDNYSVKWTKTENFEAGDYQFKVVGDDGIRLYIDGELVLDKWFDQPPTGYIVNKTLTAGDHTVVLEYFEELGGSTIILNYSKL